jgi:hypothetical protein
MNVHSVTDTYTSLGRLGRDKGPHPEAGNNWISRDKVDSSNQLPVQPVPFENRNLEALEPTDLTSVAAASSLTGEVSSQILAEGQSRLEYNLLHNLSGVRLIPSRYV